MRWIYVTAPEPRNAAWTRITGLSEGVSPKYIEEPTEFAASWNEFGGGLVYAALGERDGVTGVSLHVVLYAICNDYENVDQVIPREAAKEGAELGFTMERWEIVDALAGSIGAGSRTAGYAPAQCD